MPSGYCRMVVLSVPELPSLRSFLFKSLQTRCLSVSSMHIGDNPRFGGVTGSFCSRAQLEYYSCEKKLYGVCIDAIYPYSIKENLGITRPSLVRPRAPTGQLAPILELNKRNTFNPSDEVNRKLIACTSNHFPCGEESAEGEKKDFISTFHLPPSTSMKSGSQKRPPE